MRLALLVVTLALLLGIGAAQDVAQENSAKCSRRSLQHAA
jgi:hypothetical protein